MTNNNNISEKNIFIENSIINLNDCAVIDFLVFEEDSFGNTKQNGKIIFKIVFYLKGNDKTMDFRINSKDEFETIRQNIMKIKSPFDVLEPIESFLPDNYLRNR